MKKFLIKRFLIQLIIFTAAYLALILLFDYVFNGVVIDYIDTHLPSSVLALFYPNTGPAASVIYALIIAILAFYNIAKADKLIERANNAIGDEQLPDELRPLADTLKEFKQNIKMNEQARRYAEQQKNDLIVYLAHDLKTPLTSVIGYLSLLEESPELTLEQRSKYVGIALEKAFRLEQLINEFFEITRLNLQSVPLQRRETDLSMLLMQITVEFHPMLEAKNMTVSCNIEPNIKIWGDPDKLARVFDNLLKNAVNYGYQGSAVDIAAIKDHNNVLIRVRSRSDEIPKEKLKHIFDKFVRLDSSRHSETGGTGLGLAIAKQIVELHNGKIAADSNTQYTDFNIMLPLIKS